MADPLPPTSTRATPRPEAIFPTHLPAGPGELPETFGRYRIVKKLGQGGMGAVYLAHDTALDRPVALKVPHFSAADGPDVVERFYREARAAAALQHQNICAIHDVGEVNGVPYLTMAYVEGKPLSSFLTGGKHLAPNKAAALVRQLALVLKEAHARGIIHRDLKPSNIMIAAQGKPIIMDFGLARRLHSSDLPLTRGVMGTPHYMAPEQAAGEGAVGPGHDIYSLGVIFYELLTGQLPFQGPIAVVLAQLMTKEPPPPSWHRPGLDPALEAICLKAMAKSPTARYSSMQDFAQALGQWLQKDGKPETGPIPPVATLVTTPTAVPTAQPAPPETYKAPTASPTLPTMPAPVPVPVASAVPLPAPAPSGPRRPWVPLLAAVVILGAVLGTMFFFLGRTKPPEQATICIEVTDPKATVLLVGAEERTVEPGQPLRVPAGDYQIVVKYGDVVVESRPITVKPGDNPDEKVIRQAPLHDSAVWRGVYNSGQLLAENNPHMLLEIGSRKGDSFAGILYAPAITESRKGIRIKGQLVGDSVVFEVDTADKSAGEWAGCKFNGKVEHRQGAVVLKGGWPWGSSHYVFELTLQRPAAEPIEKDDLWDGVYASGAFTDMSPRMLLKITRRDGQLFEGMLHCPQDMFEGARTGLEVKGRVLAGVFWFDSDTDKRKAKDWAGLQFTGTLERKDGAPLMKGAWAWGSSLYIFELTRKREQK